MSIEISFEFFPPKNEKTAATLWRSVARLAPLAPEYVSVTYGAGGSTREKTHATVREIQTRTGLPTAAHLTCVSHTRDEVDALARSYWDNGIKKIVALRGDMPDGRPYRPHPDGYAYALDMVCGLKRIADFDISVACYPERHPESPGNHFDIEYLKRKTDAGASRALSQFFFDNDVFLRFRDRCAAAGIKVPLVAGILPVTNFGQLLKFAGLCGASVPDRLHRRFNGLDRDAETRHMVAFHEAITQVEALIGEGVTDFHFYTLNRAELTYAICHALGVRPRAPKPAAVA